MYPYVADVVVVLDGSASVKKKDFKQFKEFVKLLVNSYNVSENGVRLSVIEYSDDANLIIPLNQFYDVGRLKSEIDRIQPSGGSSHTDKALDKAWKEGFSSKNGARPGIPKILILVTDGKSSGKTTLENAVLPLRLNGIVVHIVAIGNDAKHPSVVGVAAGGDHVHPVGTPDDVTSVIPGIIRMINKNLDKGKCWVTLGIYTNKRRGAY